MPSSTEPPVHSPRASILACAALAFFLASLLAAGQNSAPAYAQIHDELSLEVADVSDPDAPIKVSSGLITFKQEVYPDHVESICTSHVELENVSRRAILAYEVSFYAIPHYGMGVSQVNRVENFFRENLTFVPGSQDVQRFHCPGSTKVSRGGVAMTPQKYTGAPKAELKVVFVQFDDGSKYGSSDWGEHLSEGRAATIERMKELLQAYRSGGESALRMTMARELARPENSSYTQAALRIFDDNLKTNGPEAFISKINDRLKAAQLHASAM